MAILWAWNGLHSFLGFAPAAQHNLQINFFLSTWRSEDQNVVISKLTVCGYWLAFLEARTSPPMAASSFFSAPPPPPASSFSSRRRIYRYASVLLPHSGLSRPFLRSAALRPHANIRNSPGETAAEDARTGVAVYRPRSYKELLSDASRSLVSALDDGKTRLEIDFPYVPLPFVFVPVYLEKSTTL